MPISEADKIAVVIPAYNEEKAIGAVVQRLLGEHPHLKVVVVDDGSRDGTWQVLNTLPIYRLRHLINMGQGAALQTGISFAAKLPVDYIVTFDADGQHRPSDMPRFIDALRDGGFAIAIGSRFLNAADVANIPAKRRTLLRLATIFTRVTTGLKLSDTHNGYRAFRTSAAPALEMRINGMAHASEILENIARSRLPWTEVPVTIDYTEYSKAKGQKASNMINIIWELIRR